MKYPQTLLQQRVNFRFKAGLVFALSINSTIEHHISATDPMKVPWQ